MPELRGPEDHVVLGYCHNGTVTQDWMKCLIDFIVYDLGSGGHWSQIMSSKGPYIAHSRNEIVRAFLENDESHWLWMLDIDMTWDASTFERLLEIADPIQRPIVSALYVTHISTFDWEGPSSLAPPIPVCPAWTRMVDGHPYQQIREVPEEDLVELTSCGMGCTLIHRSVLEYVGELHAGDQWKWFGHDLVDVGAGKMIRAGEDVTFCRRARDAGFSLWGSTEVRCGHLKSQLLTPAHVTPGAMIAAG